MPEKASRTTAGTVLAFDFGLQRIGVAVGEPELGTAHPLPGIAARTQPGRLTAVERLVNEWQPSMLVVGRPLGEDAILESERQALEQRLQGQVDRTVDDDPERALIVVLADVSQCPRKVRIGHVGHGDQEVIRQIDRGHA